MHILFITDKFIPERGGSQIIFAHLYAHLPEHRVTIVTRRCEGDLNSDTTYPHRVVRVPYLDLPRVRSLTLARALGQAARRVATEDPVDLVVCGQPLESAPVGVPLARRLGVPVLIHTFAEDVTSYLDHPLLTPVIRNALRSAACVTTISNFTREHLVRLGVPPGRIVLLYPGVTPENWGRTGREAEIRARFGLEGRRVLISLSRLIPRKGQDTVLRALPEIRRRVPEVIYLIAGGGPEESRLRDLARELDVLDCVRFAGSVDNREAVDYYYASDVFVMPNRQMPNGDVEGFGLVFLEANVCGLPVIGGRSGGAVDAIVEGSTGYLVDPLSVEAVAARCSELLLDPEKARRMGEAGRARVLDEFTWDRAGRVLADAVALATRERQAQA